MEAVKDMLSAGSILKGLISIWSGVASNPVSATVGIVVVTGLFYVIYLYYKRWVDEQNKKMSEIGRVVDRNEFFENEADRTAERNEIDNAKGKDPLEDLP